MSQKPSLPQSAPSVQLSLTGYKYVRSGGFIHSNSVESYFALLKRGVYGTFHSVSEAHLHRYLNEFDFRLSHKKLSDTERGEALLSHAKGKRLMYRQPDEAQDA